MCLEVMNPCLQTRASCWRKAPNFPSYQYTSTEIHGMHVAKQKKQYRPPKGLRDPTLPKNSWGVRNGPLKSIELLPGWLESTGSFGLPTLCFHKQMSASKKQLILSQSFVMATNSSISGLTKGRSICLFSLCDNTRIMSISTYFFWNHCVWEWASKREQPNGYGSPLEEWSPGLEPKTYPPPGGVP